FKSGIENRATKILRGLGDGRFDAGHMIDPLLLDRSIEIVRAKRKRAAGKIETVADPIGLDMIEVVEVSAADRDGSERLFFRRTGEMIEPMSRFEGERKKGEKAAGFILQLAQLTQ